MDPQFSEPGDLRLGATHMVIPVALFNRMASVYYGSGPEEEEVPGRGVREPQVNPEVSDAPPGPTVGDFQSGPGFGHMAWPEGDPNWVRVGSRSDEVRGEHAQ